MYTCLIKDSKTYIHIHLQARYTRRRMTKRIVRNLELIKALNHCNSVAKKHMLKNAQPEVVNAICDCIHNVLQGNVPLSHHNKRKLKSKKEILRKLTNRRNKTPIRKKLLIQHGSGFLSSILGPVIKVISGMLE